MRRIRSAAKDRGALEHDDEHRRPPAVIRIDFAGKLGDPAADAGGRDQRVEPLRRAIRGDRGSSGALEGHAEMGPERPDRIVLIVVGIGVRGADDDRAKAAIVVSAGRQHGGRQRVVPSSARRVRNSGISRWICAFMPISCSKLTLDGDWYPAAARSCSLRKYFSTAWCIISDSAPASPSVSIRNHVLPPGASQTYP